MEVFKDEVIQYLNELFLFHDEVIKGLDEEYERNTKKLQDILFCEGEKTVVANKTPQQVKKRSKRLTALDEGDTDDNTSIHDSSSSEPVKSTRPVRAAKLNLDLKEKNLNQKIRRPSNFDANSTTNITIKQEKPEYAHPKAVKNSKTIRLSRASSKSQIEAMDVDETTKSSVSDTSIVIMTKQNNVVEIDSDGEGDRMPPPVAPAPKKRVGPKKKISQEKLDLDANKSIKNEKMSLPANNDRSTKSSVDSNISDQSNKAKGTKKKGSKAKPIPMPIVIKEEKKSLSINNNEATNEDQNIYEKETVTRTTSQSQKSNRAGSFDSVYEDAISPPWNEDQRNGPVDQYDEPVLNADEATNTNAPIDNLSKIKTLILNVAPALPKSQKTTNKEVDSTFVTTKDIPTVAHNLAVALADATFVQNATVTNMHHATFNMEEKKNNLDATVTLQEEQNINSNATFDVRLNANPSETYVRASIMTEDNTEDEYVEEEEMPKPKYKPKPASKINKNQIFNPFIQSPLKKKVEAFEKAAANNAAEQNPPQRQTRTKTRAKQQNDENKEVDNMTVSAIKESSKVQTPTIGRNFGRILTPSQSSSSFTPTMGGIVKKMPNSASKAIGITKALSTVGKTSSGLSTARSRENSSEDIKRGYMKFQQLAAERKKKQEMASNLREQKEKERADRLKRLMEEREEKMRAVEHKRQLEEIQKNLKLSEEKNEQKRKLEKQKLLEKQAAAAKRERELLENLKIQKAKELMQLKYLKNQKLLQVKAKALPQYNFEMLHTDDETDEEDEIAKKRPPLPDWSKKEVRRNVLDKQAYIPARLIDKFFMVQPLTPDLREIFPDIESKHCKRNSSVCWSTPPRYSELPKY